MINCIYRFGCLPTCVVCWLRVFVSLLALLYSTYSVFLSEIVYLRYVPVPVYNSCDSVLFHVVRLLNVWFVATAGI